MATFIDAVNAQRELDRLVHGERDQRELAVTAAARIGYLLEAVAYGDSERVKNEILRVAAPLLEMYTKQESAGEQLAFNF
ncbi:MAG: hypothetical protein A4E53_01542 [Pelotomaculum sp. PtaB.Bin104]|nr:MAG: hypothetical protein A4E53_01542 [Pelotomaculum sp. PtaB.Bin104]